MKKFTIILFVFALLAPCLAISEGSGIDWDTKTTEEILVIISEANEALCAKNEKTMLNTGRYVVGKDIAAGHYVITAYGTNSDEDTRFASHMIRVYYNGDAIAQMNEAVIEHDKASSEARKNKEAGKEYEFPANIDYSKYIVCGYSLDVGETYTVNLEEGQVLSISNSSYNEALPLLTIEKTSGLFMD